MSTVEKITLQETSVAFPISSPLIKLAIRPKKIPIGETQARTSNKMKVEVTPSQIVLKTELNKIGEYKVDINFHSEVSAQISIKIDKIQSK